MRDRDLGARLQPDRRRPARGPRPEAPRPCLESPLLVGRGPAASSSGPSAARSTPSTASRSTSRPARRSGSSASRAAARASPRSRSSGSCRAPAGSRAGTALFEGRDLLKLADDELRGIRGREIAMIFQDPMTSLNPVLTIGRQIREALETHFGMDEGRRGGARRRAARPGRHPERAGAAARLPAPVLGRDAAAGDDRDGARLRAEAPDRRRADDGARRDDPGADPRPAARARRRAGRGADPDHARPRRRRRHVRARERDVRRHVRGDGLGRAALRAARAIRTRSACCRASRGSTRRRKTRAAPDRGRAARHARAAAGVPVRSRAAATRSRSRARTVPPLERDRARPQGRLLQPGARRTSGSSCARRRARA